MRNTYFRFKQFTVHHERCAMKVTTDGCLFGAWVARILSNSSFATGNTKLLDIGAGTGLLSLMVAQKNEGRIDAVEIDAAAAQQAAENIAASPWKERITVISEDVLKWKTTGTYNFVFTNPPFYEKELKSGKGAKNIAHHDEGLKLNDLLFFINMHLKEEGCFFLLLPAKREYEIEPLLQCHHLFLHQTVFVQQTLKHKPFRLMIQGGRQKVESVSENILSIRDQKDEYTSEFISLLMDYYLYL